jgi:hypothetical protein
MSDSRHASMITVFVTCMLTVITLFRGGGVRAANCYSDGENVGMICRNDVGGGQACLNCAGGSCGVLAGEDHECYGSCFDGASSVCGS